MKFKDIRKKYGTKFVFNEDVPPYPYMVVDNGGSQIDIVSLTNGKMAYGFNDNDAIMKSEITLIKE